MAEVIPFEKLGQKGTKKGGVPNVSAGSMKKNEEVTSLEEFRKQQFDGKVAAWKNKIVKGEKSKDFWAKFVDQKFIFDQAFRAEALPGDALSKENPKEDFPIMRFREGRFLFFNPQFGGVFVGTPINDPTGLGQCYFLVSEEILKYLFAKKEKEQE